MIFTPGHTKGHAVMLWKNRFLFTGDHLPWNTAANALRPFNDACWYSWEEQIVSVEKLAVFADVTHVLPGHGERWTPASAGVTAAGVTAAGVTDDSSFPRKRESSPFPSMITEAVSWMRTVSGR